MKKMEDGRKVGKNTLAKRRARILMCFFGLVFIVSLVYAALAMRGGQVAPQVAVPVDPDAHFASCSLLQADCTDPVSCGLNSYCGDGGHRSCRVYDCGETYGVFAESFSGEVTFKNEPKPVVDADLPVRDSCRGTMAVMGENCTEDRMEVKVKLATAGSCEIESFALIYEGSGAQPNNFVDLGDGNYTITASKCGKVSQIIPAAKGGIGLELDRSGY